MERIGRIANFALPYHTDQCKADCKKELEIFDLTATVATGQIHQS